MRINMLSHCFPVNMFTQLYNRDAAFTKLNDDAAQIGSKFALTKRNKKLYNHQIKTTN